MTEPQNATDAIVQEIDAEIDAILEEESVTSDPVGASEDGTQGEPSNDLKGQLTQLGLSNEEIPEDLSPQMQGLLSKAIAKADERIRGFQSGFDRTASEFGAKAKVYDQLMAMPEFHEWLAFRQNGGAPAPTASEPAAPKLDLSNLPADPMERLGVLVEHFAEAVVRKHVDPLKNQVGTVGAVIGKMGWDGFVAAHPDAPNYKQDMDRLIARGFTAEEAYRYAKGASVDEKVIEDKVLARVKERMAEKRKASGLGLPQNTPSGNSPATDYTQYAEENGMAATILKAMQDAEQELGGSIL